MPDEATYPLSRPLPRSRHSASPHKKKVQHTREKHVITEEQKCTPAKSKRARTRGVKKRFLHSRARTSVSAVAVSLYGVFFFSTF